MLNFLAGCRKAGLCPLLLSSPLTGLFCGQARLHAEHAAARDTPTQFLSPLPWPSGVVSSDKPERQSPGSAELFGYFSCYKSWGALRPTCHVYPGHEHYDFASAALFVYSITGYKVTQVISKALCSCKIL